MSRQPEPAGERALEAMLAAQGVSAPEDELHELAAARPALEAWIELVERLAAQS
jgi:hypothetical protein